MKTYNCLNCGTEVKKGYTKANKYCGNKCQLEYQNKVKLEEWFNGSYSNKKGIPPKVAQDWIREQQEGKCLHCGISDWNGKPITLQFDHIDGNRANNTPENIRMLCPNCHSQTPTYGVKGKQLKMDPSNIYRREHYKRLRSSMDQSI